MVLEDGGHSWKEAMAPGEGFEPPARRLTAVCSTAELPGNSVKARIAFPTSPCKREVYRFRWIVTELLLTSALFSFANEKDPPISCSDSEPGAAFCLGNRDRFVNRRRELEGGDLTQHTIRIIADDPERVTVR